MTDLKILLDNIITRPAYTYAGSEGYHNNTTYERCKDSFEQYDYIYPFTTESLTSYMEGLNDKEVLCVASSGDHAIHSYALGAKSVDTFDINCLTRYYQDLKINALAHLTYEEFFTFFSNSYHQHNNGIELLKKLKEFIEKDTYILFEYFINRYAFNAGLFSNNLFYPKQDNKRYRERCLYFDDNEYYKVQEKLQGKKTSFINTSLADLPNKLTKKYDAIFLSNISTYISEYDIFLEYVDSLLDYLNENGRIYISYLYGDQPDTSNNSIVDLGFAYRKDIPSVCGKDYIDSVYYINKK